MAPVRWQSPVVDRRWQEQCSILGELDCHFLINLQQQWFKAKINTHIGRTKGDAMLPDFFGNATNADTSFGFLFVALLCPAHVQLSLGLYQKVWPAPYGTTQRKCQWRCYLVTYVFFSTLNTKRSLPRNRRSIYVSVLQICNSKCRMFKRT